MWELKSQGKKCMASFLVPIDKQGLESVCAPSLSSFCKGAFSLLYRDFIRIINCIFVLIFSKQLLKKHLDFQINATRFTSRIDCIYIRAASFVIAHILQHAFLK